MFRGRFGRTLHSGALCLAPIRVPPTTPQQPYVTAACLQKSNLNTLGDLLQGQQTLLNSDLKFANETVVELMRMAAANNFKSTTWTTRIEANNRGAEILPGAIGVEALIAGTGFGRITCYNIDSIRKPSDITAFLRNYPLPQQYKKLKGDIIRPRCFYWKKDWKDCWSSEHLSHLVALQAAQKRYKLRRELWICGAELESMGIALRRGHSGVRGVSILDGLVLMVYNAEQTTNPDVIEQWDRSSPPQSFSTLQYPTASS